MKGQHSDVEENLIFEMRFKVKKQELPKETYLRILGLGVNFDCDRKTLKCTNVKVYCKTPNYCSDANTIVWDSYYEGQSFGLKDFFTNPVS